MRGHGFSAAPVLASLAVMFWLFWSTSAHGAEQQIQCPLTLPAVTVQGKASPPGWRLVMPQEATLTTAGMLHGPPEESGYLAPAESKRRKQGKRSSWVQRWKLERPHWYETWLYCGYGGGSGPLQLFKLVAKDVRECTLTSSTTDGVVDQMVFVCK